MKARMMLILQLDLDQTAGAVEPQNQEVTFDPRMTRGVVVTVTSFIQDGMVYPEVYSLYEIQVYGYFINGRRTPFMT